jgi:hypothetical protein
MVSIDNKICLQQVNHTHMPFEFLMQPRKLQRPNPAHVEISATKIKIQYSN